MKNVVLGVSGSIAAYRAADLARELMRNDCVVRVCLTDAAQKFVSPAMFEALTGQPCLQGVFEEPVPGRMAHIDWARQADLFIVAPATANTIAKLAAGFADDMLTTIALATDAPWVIAPAMNPTMYESPTTQAALASLKARNAEIVEPLVGDVACGENGQGKFADAASIVSRVRLLLARKTILQGQKVLITSGPTVEPIDVARVLTNRSSGKMGAAIARAALLMGAQVTVVAGPSTATYPRQAHIVKVQTAIEMKEAAMEYAPSADFIIGAAAVADYRPAETSSSKVRRSEESIMLRLVPNPDVIAALAKSAKKSATVVGFAAEPNDDVDAANAKLERKGLTAIAVNNVSRDDIGFDSDFNDLTLVFQGRVLRSGRQSKLGCALFLLEAIVTG